jgi:K+-transporting ATPase ATPase A chain
MSCGAVTLAHEISFTPLGHGAHGDDAAKEVVFGGDRHRAAPDADFAILWFIAGLMIGRTPEYLGKKNRSERIEMKLTW